MSYISESRQLAAETLKKNFAKRGMEAFYCETKEEACKLILSMIPSGASVTWGGTESMAEAGVCEAVEKGDYDFIDRKNAKTPEEARALYGKIVCADYFLTSTNAFTKAGRNNYRKLRVRVPKSKLSTYKKLLKSKGLSSKAKITK